MAPSRTARVMWVGVGEVQGGLFVCCRPDTEIPCCQGSFFLYMRTTLSGAASQQKKATAQPNEV